MNAMEHAKNRKAGAVTSRDRMWDPPLVGRKSVLMGLAASMGVALTNVAPPSANAAGTQKLIAATQPAYAMRWTPSTAYARGQQVISPDNDVVSASVAHTSSQAYASDTAKWVLSSTFTPTLVSGKGVVRQDELVVNVLKYGAVGDYDGWNGTDNLPAFNAAIAAAPNGSRVFVPSGKYYLSDVLVLPNVIDFDCAAGGLNQGGRGVQLVFAAGKSGIKVTAASGWRVGPFDLVSKSTGAGTGVGFFVQSGRGTIDRTSVEGFGSHGFHFKAGAAVGGGNVNNSVLDHPYAYGNYGDGIRLEGSDAQACFLTKPDVVANYGWGINLIGCARNIIVAPHADQQYNGAPGAYRDDGTSNVFEHVYSEAGVKLLLDTNSVYCTVSGSLYGQPAIQDLTLGKTATITDKDGSVRRSYLKSADGTNQYTTQAGEWAAGALSLSDASGMVYVYYPPALGNVWYFNTDLRPYTDSVRDLGGATQRWRNGFFSSWVRDGTTTKPARPSAATAGPGAHMFDTTLNKPIWSDGAVWRDAAGTAV